MKLISEDGSHFVSNKMCHIQYKNLNTQDRFSYIVNRSVIIHLLGSLSDHHEEPFDLIVHNQQIRPHFLINLHPL